MCVDAFMVCWEKGEEKEKATEYAIESFAFFKKQIQGKKSLSWNDTYNLFLYYFKVFFIYKNIKIIFFNFLKVIFYISASKYLKTLK
jgi:hypothetical protein